MPVQTDDAFVRFVQHALAERGHDVGPADGIAGDRTSRALIAALGPVSTPVVTTSASSVAWDGRSLRSLTGVHSDLRRIMDRARLDTPLPFVVIEGLRTVARQKQLVASGASQTMRSRHLTGHAVDIVPLGADGQLSWDWPLYHRLAVAVKQAASSLGLPIEWGGDWKSFKDGPHWQLPWASYP